MINQGLKMHINCPFSFIFSLTGMDREFIYNGLRKRMSFLYLLADFVYVMFYFSMMNFLHMSYVPDGGRCEHLSIRTDRQDNNGRRDHQEICQENKSDVMGFFVSSDFINQFY